METDTFAGRMSEMRDSPWLASEDLENPDGPGYIETVLTVATVMEIRDAQFKGGRTKAKGYALKFREIERMLYLNGVNREKLKEMFGRKASDVVGQAITLYVNPRVKMAGKTVPGIRVKDAPEKTISPADQKAIADTKVQIAEAADVATLKGIGGLIGKKSSAVKEAVRVTYEKRLAELKEG